MWGRKLRMRSRSSIITAIPGSWVTTTCDTTTPFSRNPHDGAPNCLQGSAVTPEYHSVYIQAALADNRLSRCGPKPDAMAESGSADAQTRGDAIADGFYFGVPASEWRTLMSSKWLGTAGHPIYCWSCKRSHAYLGKHAGGWKMCLSPDCRFYFKKDLTRI